MGTKTMTAFVKMTGPVLVLSAVFLSSVASATAVPEDFSGIAENDVLRPKTKDPNILIQLEYRVTKLDRETGRSDGKQPVIRITVEPGYMNHEDHWEQYGASYKIYPKHVGDLEKVGNLKQLTDGVLVRDAPPASRRRLGSEPPQFRRRRF